MHGSVKILGVRACTVNDLPWILSLAHRRYTRKPDPGTTLAWLARVFEAPDGLAIRTEQAFLAAVLHIPPWWPDDRECHIQALVAAPGYHWDAVRLLRASIEWARVKDCVRWYLSSETDYDFAALARRVGAVPGHVKYKIDLGE